ncbi:MAG: hypothetical protein IJ446_06885 [Oscillospiraceae bacterium]|nr:hypothetical protein [Oscillospiraceae bacterium]
MRKNKLYIAAVVICCMLSACGSTDVEIVSDSEISDNSDITETILQTEVTDVITEKETSVTEEIIAETELTVITETETATNDISVTDQIKALTEITIEETTALSKITYTEILNETLYSDMYDVTFIKRNDLPDFYIDDECIIRSNLKTCNSSINWDNAELTELFNKAHQCFLVLYGQWGDVFRNNFHTVYKTFLFKDSVTGEVNERTLIPTGYNYESAYNHFKSVFTDRFLHRLQYEDYFFTQYEGEAYGISIETGCNPVFTKAELFIEEQSETKIVIRNDIYINPEGTEYLWESRYYDVLKTKDGWRFDSFELWYY